MSQRTLGTIARHVLLVGVTLFVVLPIIWIFLVGFKSLYEAMAYPPTFVPQNPTFSNFIYVLTRFPDVKRYYLNSIIVTATTVPLVILITTLAGFAFARLRFPGRDKIFWALVVTIFFPLGFTRLFTVFELAHDLKLNDTLLGLMLPYLSIDIVLYTFILRANFRQIPGELEDAARIDGCSTTQLFLRIMVPLVRDGIAVVALLSFLQVWGEYLYALTLTLENARTLPVGLSMLSETTAGDTSFNILAAAYILAIVPPLLLLIFSQRLMLKGLTAGALKF